MNMDFALFRAGRRCWRSSYWVPQRQPFLWGQFPRGRRRWFGVGTGLG